MEEDSWEDVPFVIDEEKPKKSLKEKYFLNIHKILFIFKKIKEKEILKNDKIKEKASDFNKFQFIESLIKEEDLFLRNVSIFLTSVFYKLKIRICFVVDEKLSCFLQTLFYNKKESCKKIEEEVIGLDYTFNLNDLTYIYSKKHSFKITLGMKNMFKCLFSEKFGDLFFDGKSDFIDFDKKMLNKIPNSLSKMKKHPFFIIESVLHPSFIIWPKRNVVGYFKGEKVFLQENIKKLQSEYQWKCNGKKIKDEVPFRIHKNRKLYAYWQVEDVSIETFSDKLIMDYFHPNFLPKDSFYSDNEYSEELALYLNLDYRKVMVGFTNKFPLLKGIFVKKIYEKFFLISLKEFCFYKEIELSHEKNKQIFKEWELILRKVKRYLEIKKMID